LEAKTIFSFADKSDISAYNWNSPVGKSQSFKTRPALISWSQKSRRSSAKSIWTWRLHSCGYFREYQ